MNKKEQNTSGGEIESMNEIQLGGGPYVVYRSFSEEHTVPDLIVNRILREKKENSTFDETTDDTV